MAEYLEALMFVAFSTSWYVSIWKMIAFQQPCGKSRGFIALAFLAYALGLLAKLNDFSETDQLSWLALLYIWNLTVIIVAVCISASMSRKKASFKNRHESAHFQKTTHNLSANVLNQ